MKKPNQDPNDQNEYVQWMLPVWAADIIMETLQMDMNSHAFDATLREDIENAYDTIEVTQ